MTSFSHDTRFSAARQTTPIFLITGFLGSGKTTLIRRILEQSGMSDTALIINEFGEVGLDQRLVQSAVENVLLMENGCVCCSIRGDLTDTINDLFAKVAAGTMPAFSRIVIETTGLAEPAPIIQEITSTRGLMERVRLEKVIVTVDALLGGQQLEHSPEAAAQAALADTILVTKAELADTNAVNALVVDLQMLNPGAEIARTSNAGFDVTQLLKPASGVFRGATAKCCGDDTHCTHTHDTHIHDDLCSGHDLPGQEAARHHHGIESWSIRHQPALAWEQVRRLLDLLYSLKPANLLRTKAILHLKGQDRPLVIHGVGNLIDPPTWLGQRPQGDLFSEIVVITKNMDSCLIGRAFEAIVLADNESS